MTFFFTLASESWSATGPLRPGMGLHTSAAVVVGGEYALGDARLRELRAQGESLDVDQAVANAFEAIAKAAPSRML